MAVTDVEFWVSRLTSGKPEEAEMLAHELFDAYREANSLPRAALDVDTNWAMQVFQRHRMAQLDPDHDPSMGLADLQIIQSLGIRQQFRIAGKLLYEAQRYLDPMMVAQLDHAVPSILHRLRIKVQETDDPQQYLTFRQFLSMGVPNREHSLHIPGWEDELYDQIEDCRNYLKNNNISFPSARGR
jgi:hypothetical protein